MQVDRLILITRLSDGRQLAAVADEIPAAVAFQGLCLDDQGKLLDGQKVSGNIDLAGIRTHYALNPLTPAALRPARNGRHARPSVPQEVVQ